MTPKQFEFALEQIRMDSKLLEIKLRRGNKLNWAIVQEVKPDGENNLVVYNFKGDAYVCKDIGEDQYDVRMVDYQVMLNGRPANRAIDYDLPCETSERMAYDVMKMARLHPGKTLEKVAEVVAKVMFEMSMTLKSETMLERLKVLVEMELRKIQYDIEDEKNDCHE